MVRVAGNAIHACALQPSGQHLLPMRRPLHLLCLAQVAACDAATNPPTYKVVVSGSHCLELPETMLAPRV